MTSTKIQVLAVEILETAETEYAGLPEDEVVLELAKATIMAEELTPREGADLMTWLGLAGEWPAGR